MKKISLYEEFLKDTAILDELQEGIWVADNFGRIVFANCRLARLLGYDLPEKLIGKMWRQLFPPSEAVRLSKINSESRTLNTQVVARDNRLIPVSVTVLTKSINNTNWYLGSVIESVGHTEEEVSNWTSRQVMENSVDGICIIENKQIVYVNRRMEELTGYSPPQLGRMSIEQLLSPADRKTVSSLIVEPHHIIAPIHHEVKLRARTGRELECELRIVPVEKGGEISLICYFRDISELKQAERSRAEFIAMVSHDLRTPLAAIKEAIALLADTAAGRLEDKQRRYLNIAREEMDRLNRMIDNLLEVSRMESGKLTLNLEAVDLPQLLNTALESLALFLTKKNLKVERRLPPKMPPVLGDRDRLLRVFNNLLDNAIKYSPEGGTIKVEADFIDPEAPILSEPGILANTGYVEITITDQGPGIPAEFLERVFGKFERVDPYGPGIGLGLAIVRSIIELHHGKIWVRSTLGEGASFSFVLPLKEGNQ